MENRDRHTLIPCPTENTAPYTVQRALRAAALLSINSLSFKNNNISACLCTTRTRHPSWSQRHLQQDPASLQICSTPLPFSTEQKQCQMCRVFHLSTGQCLQLTFAKLAEPPLHAWTAGPATLPLAGASHSADPANHSVQFPTAGGSSPTLA